MKKTLTLFICFLLIACSKIEKDQTSSPHQLTITTTLYPVTFFTEQIGKQYVHVTSVLEPGANLHQFHLSDESIHQMLSSDLVLYLDGEMESYLASTIPSLEEANIHYIDIVKQIKTQTTPQIGEGQTLISGTLTVEESNVGDQKSLNQLLSDQELDPSASNLPIQKIELDPYNHLWLHPSYALMICELILDQLTELMPEYKAIFETNFNELKTKLVELHSSFESFSELEQPYFLVTHGAYSVWESYGLIQIPLSSALETPLNQEELTQLIHLVQNLDLNYLYFESNLNSSIADEVQDKLRLKGLNLYNLETLTTEQMEAGENYFTLMDKNIESLKQEIY